MPRYATLSHAKPRHATPRRAVLRCATLCYAVLGCGAIAALLSQIRRRGRRPFTVPPGRRGRLGAPAQEAPVKRVPARAILGARGAGAVRG